MGGTAFISNHSATATQGTFEDVHRGSDLPGGWSLNGVHSGKVPTYVIEEIHTHFDLQRAVLIEELCSQRLCSHSLEVEDVVIRHRTIVRGHCLWLYVYQGLRLLEGNP